MIRVKLFDPAWGKRLAVGRGHGVCDVREGGLVIEGKRGARKIKGRGRGDRRCTSSLLNFPKLPALTALRSPILLSLSCHKHTMRK